MSKRTCSIEECGRDRVQFGEGIRCRAHYLEWRSGLTCSVDGCQKPVHTVKTMLCGMHRKRLHVHGSTSPTEASLGDASGTCVVDGCGKISFQHGGGTRCRPHYDEWRASLRCRISGCSKKAATVKHELCAMHYRRLRVQGDVGGAESTVVDNSGKCSVEDCGEKASKRYMCDTHYQQMRKWGEVRPLAYKSGTVAPCLVCGQTERVGIKSLKFCSSRCEMRYYVHGDAASLTEKPCTRCGDPIDLLPNGPSGKWVTARVLMCDRCARARHLRHGFSASVLAKRDGTDCSICDTSVDMSLNYPDPMSPSVDHVIPFAQGGTHDPENLALAHYRCNNIKRDRVGFKIAFTAA